MRVPHPSHVFATAELSTAAYLIVGKHLRLIDIDIDVGGRGIFIFDDPDHLAPALESALMTSTWPASDSSCNS